MADLQELFARLKSPSNAASSPGAPSSGANANTGYHQPSVSSPIFSPQPGGPQPHHSSAIMSPNTSAMGTPAPDPSSSDRTASLLNLLKFNQPSASSPAAQDTGAERRASSSLFPQEQPPPPGTHSRGISASDLVASFMRKPQAASPAIAQPAPTKPDFRAEASPSENPQDLLLRLLNHPKPPQSDSPAPPPQSIERDVPEARVDDLAQDLADAKLEAASPQPGAQYAAPMHTFGSVNVSQSTAFEPATTPSAKNPLFTYVNPFEQLSASSPRNRTPKPEGRSGANTPKVEILKHGRETPSTASGTAPASKSRKLSGTASPSSAREAETVAEAVAEVGQTVDQQVEEALASLEKEPKDTNGKEAAAQDEAPLQPEDLEKAVEDVATAAHEQLQDKETRREFENQLPKEVAKAVEDVVEDIAQEKVADSWESAEDSPGKDDNAVTVFNFPMRPFVSIELKKLRDPPMPIRQDNIMDIARLKKDFDQIDRNLVTVSKTYIAYALSKHGGFRLIRQDTGKYKQVFNTTKERIFNLQLCTSASSSPTHETETILATGVDGSVFWTTVAGPNDTYAEDNLEEQGFIFPPVPAQDDNTSGGQLKTRAKKSSRHPEFFGIGRGKSIYIVWPQTARMPIYTDPKTRVCESEKYLQNRCLRIVTGKAGKDFAFSEDDTVIASLDKAGRLRFWDIRDLIAEGSNSHERIPAKEVRNPTMQLNTVAAGDKSWPTSVVFLDKERPCMKGIALRYLIVGLKQNHTLQLWDLGLQKPVQEINFPHENESDAICSIAYHPKTGILAVGHPTRNSIYFIHLSAPRYNLPAMCQAKYISRLAEKDQDLPRPESTAIMSGIREFSFASKGQLRSLEMLQEPAAAPESYAPDEAPLFELYVMHSKGVTCLGIRKEDLGWSKDSKVLHPVDAEATGSININPIRVLAASEQAPSTTESSANGEATQSTTGRSRATPREVAKKEPASSRSRATSQAPETASMIASTLERVENQQDAARAAMINGGEKTEKKKKKKGAAAAADTASQTSSAAKASSLTASAGASYANVAQRAKTPPPEPVKALEDKKLPETEVPEWASRLFNQLQSSGAGAPAIAPAVDQDNLKNLERTVTSEFNKVFNKELESLYRRLDDDKRVQDAAGAAKMDAVLRLVSSTLTENVEKSMSRIVTQNLQKIILPSLSELVAGTIERRLTEILAQSMQVAVPREMKQALPHSINMAFKDPETLSLISDLVAGKVTGHIEQAVRNTVGSTVSNAVYNATQQLSGDLERRMADQFRQAELQRQRDAAKIEQLTGLVTGLAETISAMSASQASFQDEILKLQKQAAQSDGSARSAPSTAVSATAKKSEADLEQDEITRLMSSGQFEEGTIMWLQSPRQAQLFDDLFVRCNPAYIQNLTPLVALSVSAAVTSSLETHIAERLIWLDSVFNAINPKDPDLMEVAPKIMDVLSSRLQAAYMQIAETEPGNPILRKISMLSRRAMELKEMAR